MEKVLNQAEQLAEAILDSEIYIKMRLTENAAMRDEEATALINEYSERRKEVENLLASGDLDHTELGKAGEKLDAAQKAMEENPKIKAMREANEAFTDMMKQVNKIIRFVVTGESDEEDGCTGSCESCEGCHTN